MTQTGHVRVITDSASDLTAELAAQHSIAVVPLAVRFGDAEFIDGVDLSVDAFWDKLRTEDEMPKTAAPSSEHFELAYSEAKAAGASAVVCITLSSKLSATFQAATKAAEVVAGDFEVHVVDSETCTIAERTLCLEAARLAAEGMAAAQIVERIEALRTRTRLFGVLDDMEHLRRGGRVGAAGAFFASLLSVKPLIKITGGVVEPESRQRTRRRALDHLAKIVVDDKPVSHVAVAHSGATDIAEFVQQLEPVVDPSSVPQSIIGPTIGVHGGPRLIAVSYVSEGPLPS